MPDHRDAVEVTIAATNDQSEFTLWVLKWWKAGVAALLVVSVVLIANQVVSDAEYARDIEAWERLGQAVSVENPALFIEADSDVIASMADAETDNISGPWARYLEATVRAQSGDDQGALAALGKLGRDHPHHILNSLRVSFGGEPTPQTVVERLSQSLEDQAAWESAHPFLFDNPAPSAGAPSVRIVTTEGLIVVGLYPDLAPKHVENFLKLCAESYYNDTKFHRVIAGFMIQGGDPNSKEADVDLWGEGGPGHKVDHEDNDLRHFTGYLSAAKRSGEKESSGSQFFITTGDQHHLDGLHVVFGKVLSGMDTVGIIESSVIVPGTRRPETPALITSTEVL